MIPARPSHFTGLMVAWGCLVAGMAWATQASGGDEAAPGRFPAPPPARDPSSLGAGIQRTMTLLKTSTPQQRNTVRILFYGQSITEQDWWKEVARDLRARFPSANLIIENRAIGGFASQLLIRPAEHDVYPFYPDLLILHVYGSHIDYERLIKETRSRTAAEVLMLTDHVTQRPPAVIDEKRDKASWWDDFMNRQFLPDTARKYGCGLADNRGAWTDYLKANQLEPQALLKDGVHLNDHGNHLMAALVKRYLVYRPDLDNARWRDLTKTFDNLAWDNGSLKLEFEGNRVDLIGDPRWESDQPDSRLEIRIDGKRPSEFAGAYAITRPTPHPWSPLFLSRVDHDTMLVVEPWTLTVSSVAADSKRWSFSVAGGRTGPDGEGASDQPFVSNSGRVKIEPESWFRGFGKEPVPRGYTIRWEVLPMFTDVVTTPLRGAAPDLEQVVTAAQGIPNGHHVIELRAEHKDASSRRPPVRAVRVYRPPYRDEKA